MTLNRPDAPVTRELEANTNWERKKRRSRGRCGTPMGCAVLMGAWFLAHYLGPTVVYGATPPVRNACARPEAGSVAQQPAEIVSKDGKLSVVLSIRNSPDFYGNMRTATSTNMATRHPRCGSSPVTC